MTQHIFTQEGYEKLQEAIKEAREQLGKSMQAKGEAGSEQDGWHGSEYQLIAGQERVNSKRLGGLQELARNARVIGRFEEQKELVKIGNGVLIQREDGSEERYMLNGYRVDSPLGHISVESPLGKALVLAKVGETKTFWIGKNKMTVRVKKIVLPSQAESFVRREFA